MSYIPPSHGSIKEWQRIVANAFNSLGGEWQDFAPAITSGTGALTTVGATAFKYRHNGGKVEFTLDVTITTNGTGATHIDCTLPVANGADAFCIAGGREVAVHGYGLTGTINSSASSMQIRKIDNTYPAQDGARLVMTGFYLT